MLRSFLLTNRLDFHNPTHQRGIARECYSIVVSQSLADASGYEKRTRATSKRVSEGFTVTPSCGFDRHQTGAVQLGEPRKIVHGKLPQEVHAVSRAVGAILLILYSPRGADLWFHLDVASSV